MRPASGHPRKSIFSKTNPVRPPSGGDSLSKIPRTSKYQQEQDTYTSKITEVEANALRVKYDRAINLISEGGQLQKKAAFSILQDLCMEFRYSADLRARGGFLLETIFKSYLGLKSIFSLKEELNSKEQMSLVRFFTTYFEEIHKKTNNNSENLSLFFLLQANEQYHGKQYDQALNSCQKSIRYCSGSKSQIDTHLMKAFFLKSSIYRIKKDQTNQSEAIKACLDIINRLQIVISDPQTKQYVLNLKKILIERKKQAQKTEQSKKLSFHKIKRRSISLKKSESQKEVMWNKSVQKTSRNQNQVNLPIKLTLTKKQSSFGSLQMNKTSSYSKTVTHSKNPSFNFETKQMPEKPKLLKKAPIKKQPYYDATRYAVDEIQNQKPPSIFFQELMVARPEAKKQEAKDEGKQDGNFEAFESFPMPLSFDFKKESESIKSSRIEPVTHVNIGDNQLNVDNDLEEVIQQCIRQEEEQILKGYITSYCAVQQLQSMAVDENNDSDNEENLDGIINDIIDNSPDSKIATVDDRGVPKKRSNITTKSLHNSTSKQLEQQNIQREISSYSNTDFDIDQRVSLCTAYGYLSKMNVKVKVLQGFSEEDEEYRVVLIYLDALLNDEYFVRICLRYDLTNIFQSDLYSMLYELNKQILPTPADIPIQISNRLFSLVSNQVAIKRQPLGLLVVPKNETNIKTNLFVGTYKKNLRDRFLIYELNKTTTKVIQKQLEHPSPIQKKSFTLICQTPKYVEQASHRVSFKEEEVQREEEPEQYDDKVIEEYLVYLSKKINDDAKEEGSGFSSLKRFKTERLNKYTMFTYRSTMKSIQIGEYNLCVRDEDIKSLNMAIMPSDFHSKISKYFERIQDGMSAVPFQQFYYCMKFVLIKPPSSKDKQFLNCFFEELQVECLHFINKVSKVRIIMSCFKPRAIFLQDTQIFFKFELQFLDQQANNTKFIATAKDLKLIERGQNNDEINMRSSRRFVRQRATTLSQEEGEKKFSKEAMLEILKKLTPHIFIKKSYIYSAVGFQNKFSHLNYINKFRLEGRTVQGKNFMTSHLKQIHILFQKSLLIRCDCFKGFAVLTARHITGSQQFSLIFYLPKLQRSLSLALTHKILKYLTLEQLSSIFTSFDYDFKQMESILFDLHEKSEGQKRQRQAWNRMVSLLRFESLYVEGRIELLLRLGNYSAFLKDSALSQFFELDRKVYRLDMSLSKKASPLSVQLKERKDLSKLPKVKRKSSSSKDIPNKSFEIKDKVLTKTGFRNNYAPPSLQPPGRQEQDNKVFRRLQFLCQFNQIYESDVGDYVLYISLTEVLNIRRTDDDPYEVHKINFCLYLSDLCAILKKTKSELHQESQTVKMEYSEQVFSFALLLRMMTVIKHRMIKQLKVEVDKELYFMKDLFVGDHRIEKQKMFKNKLQQILGAVNSELCSLNAFKSLHKLESNVFVAHKGIMSARNGQIVCFLYNRGQQNITIYISDCKSLTVSHRVMNVQRMKLPWATFLTQSDLVTLNRRLFAYYSNILLLH